MGGKEMRKEREDNLNQLNSKYFIISFENLHSGKWNE